jgi:hypothetical protein
MILRDWARKVANAGPFERPYRNRSLIQNRRAHQAFTNFRQDLAIEWKAQMPLRRICRALPSEKIFLSGRFGFNNANLSLPPPLSREMMD